MSFGCPNNKCCGAIEPIKSLDCCNLKEPEKSFKCCNTKVIEKCCNPGFISQARFDNCCDKKRDTCCDNNTLISDRFGYGCGYGYGYGYGYPYSYWLPYLFCRPWRPYYVVYRDGTQSSPNNAQKNDSKEVSKDNSDKTEKPIEQKPKKIEKNKDAKYHLHHHCSCCHCSCHHCDSDSDSSSEEIFPVSEETNEEITE